MSSLPQWHGIWKTHWNLSNVAMIGIIFVKKFPQVYLVLKIFLMLNLSSIHLDWYDIPLMHGLDIIHRFVVNGILLSVSGFFANNWIHKFPSSLKPNVQLSCSLWHNLLALWSKPWITPHFKHMGWSELYWRYFLVCVGFLCTVIVKQPSFFTTKTYKNGRCPLKWFLGKFDKSPWITEMI
jgi:hypothetical protein